MTESSGYGSNSSTTLTPLGSGPTPSSPQSTMGQSPNNGYHLNQLHIRHVSNIGTYVVHIPQCGKNGKMM